MAQFQSFQNEFLMILILSWLEPLMDYMKNRFNGIWRNLQSNRLIDVLDDAILQFIIKERRHSLRNQLKVKSQIQNIQSQSTSFKMQFAVYLLFSCLCISSISGRTIDAPTTYLEVRIIFKNTLHKPIWASGWPKISSI